MPTEVPVGTTPDVSRGFPDYAGASAGSKDFGQSDVGHARRSYVLEEAYAEREPNELAAVAESELLHDP